MPPRPQLFSHANVCNFAEMSVVVFYKEWTRSEFFIIVNRHLRRPTNVNITTLIGMPGTFWAAVARCELDYLFLKFSAQSTHGELLSS